MVVGWGRDVWIPVGLLDLRPSWMADMLDCSDVGWWVCREISGC